MLIPNYLLRLLQPSETFCPLVRASYVRIVTGARYSVILNNGKTITIVTFASVDAIPPR
jgi:hypothetical protein